MFKGHKLYVCGRRIETSEIPTAKGITFPFPAHKIPVELFGMPKSKCYQFHTVSIDDVYDFYDHFDSTKKKNRSTEQKEKDLLNIIDKENWSCSFLENMKNVLYLFFKIIVIIIIILQYICRRN